MRTEEDQKLALQCLQIAAMQISSAPADEQVARAQHFFNFIKGKPDGEVGAPGALTGLADKA